MALLSQLCVCRRIGGQLCSNRSAARSREDGSRGGRRPMNIDMRRRASKFGDETASSSDSSMGFPSPGRAKREESLSSRDHVDQRGKEPRRPHSSRQDTRQVKEIQELAKQLMGSVEKYPSTGMKFVGQAKKRFLAINPHGKIEAAGVPQWKSGILGWWENEAAYHANKEPKGFVRLMKIVKVKHLRDQCDGRAVEVKHQQEKDNEEMVILLKTARGATEWTIELRQILSLIREDPDRD